MKKIFIRVQLFNIFLLVVYIIAQLVYILSNTYWQEAQEIIQLVIPLMLVVNVAHALLLGKCIEKQ
jgi:hypothetical protein